MTETELKQCSEDHSDYKNNGLVTKLWGGPGWIFNHSITFGYPLHPTSEQKQYYREYFIALGNVLPCKFCRESYQKFITMGDTALTDHDLENRETLTKWFYRVHNAVNNKLEIDYGVTYEDVIQKYESFRAKCGKPSPTIKGCIAPLDYKAMSFKNLYFVDAPIVPLKTVQPFIILAKIRNLDPIYFTFLDLANIFKGKIGKLKKQKCWPGRNNFCQEHIKYMRLNSIPSIEETGDWKGTPSIDELILLMFLSSNLSKTELNQVTEESFKNVYYQSVMNQTL